LSFRQNRNLENGFDGGVLEVSTNGGATFQDILAAGGTFATGGYNGTISVNFGSPIAGRQAWTGNSQGVVTTTVNLPASFAGQTVILRFRRATDSSVTGQGWRIDTISIDDVANCVLTCPADVTQDNDPNQCGAVVSYPAPTTTGNCGTSNCTLSVTSNEPVTGPGSGNKSPDWIVVNNHLVQLRAERDGGGTGRIYTITITCTDASGNSSSTSVTVTVPHNQ
jgi:hypothetical protein